MEIEEEGVDVVEHPERVRVDETDEELQSSITANVDEVRGLEEKVKATTL